MKKLCLTIIFFVLTTTSIYAQWNDDGTSVNTNNPRNVNINNSSSGPLLNLTQNAVLGSTPQSSALISTFSSIGNTNHFQNNLWVVRNSTGSDWFSTRWHDAISVDISFLTPQVNTRTWWERDPSQDIQSWGSAATTYLTIKQGSVGIGTLSPELKLHTDGATGFPASSGTMQTGIMRLGVAGGYGSVLDFGSNGVLGQGWIQSTDRSNLALNYALLLNPNGGHVGIGKVTTNDAILTVTDKKPVIQLFDTNFNPGDGSSMGRIAFGSGASEWASIETTRCGNYLDDVSAMVFRTIFSANLGGDGLKERLRISPNGNIGINAPSAMFKLHIKMDNDFSVIQRNVNSKYAGHYYITGQDNALNWNFFTGLRENSNDYHILNGQEGVDALTIRADNNYIGIGSTIPNAKLDVNGGVFLGGNNLDGANLSYLANSGRMLVGWNRTQGSGETDFISNQGAGARGGFSFYNYDNGNTIKQLMWILGNGQVLIGDTQEKQGNYMLAVAGPAIAASVTVKDVADWPDYIFQKNYTLMPLADLKNYIDKNHHLPEIPSAAEVEKDGLNLGEMNKLLVKKVEELTLYMLEKDKQVSAQQEQLNALAKQLEALSKKIDK